MCTLGGEDSDAVEVVRLEADVAAREEEVGRDGARAARDVRVVVREAEEAF